MAVDDKIIKGRDATIRITLKDAAGAVIPLTSVQAYVVNLYYPNRHVLEKFHSLETLPGHKGVVVVDAPNGVFDVLLEADKTDDAQVGELLAEAIVQSTDANFKDGFKQTGVQDQVVGKIVESTANELTDIS